jgi:hypothetical protein
MRPIANLKMTVSPPAHTPGHGGPTDPSHDELLRRGIIHTDVSRPVAIAVSVSFLLFIFIIPISQAVLEKLRGEETMLLDVFKRFPTKENLKQFEDDLDKASYVKEAVQPRVQALLTGLGRVGNSKAVLGRDGWLYYKPGITFLGGPGFLQPNIIEMRVKSSLDEGLPAVHADPRPAILAFHQALARRGIKLILFPVPDKAMLQPLQLHARGDSARPTEVPRNPDWPAFVSEMRAQGIAVFDPSPALLNPGEPPRYLVQDTHWSPAWMQSVAELLARFVNDTAALPPPVGQTSVPGRKAVAQDVERVGDIVDMLKLPEGQTLFAPQKVTVRQVQGANGAAWEPSPKADVLLLGDSFTNVFSMETMGWGAAAGLAPHLSLALGRDIDVIAQNDSGAFATRLELARELASNAAGAASSDRLAGKMVVIWEFASRELAVGDWKPADWSAPAAPGTGGR